MLPRKEQNIYPRNIDNIEAILFHYFSFPISETKKYAFKLYDNNQLELNQIEYIARKMSENISFFESKTVIKTTLSKVMGFGIAAYTLPKDKWKGSSNYVKRLHDLIERLNDK